MPTLLVVEGFRFRSFSREGTEPPHAHVRKGDAAAKFWLQPVQMAFAEGFNPAELRRIRELTFEHQTEFLRRWWHEYFAQHFSQPRARALEFVPDAFVVHLQDGRSLTEPLEWFPWLRDATPEQRSRYEFYGHGYAIHWPEIDEDISVPGLFGLPD